MLPILFLVAARLWHEPWLSLAAVPAGLATGAALAAYLGGLAVSRLQGRVTRRRPFIGRLLRRARRSRLAGQQQEAAAVCALSPAAPDGEQQTESAVLSRASASPLTT